MKLIRNILSFFILLLLLSACQTKAKTSDVETTGYSTLADVFTTTPTHTETYIPTITLQPNTQTPTIKPSVTFEPIEQESQFLFVSETIPDGTNFDPGDSFTKTWTVRNVGSTAWENYKLVLISETPAQTPSNCPQEIELTESVLPGETIEIAVELTSPEQNGSYSVWYQLQTATGTAVPDASLWASITVGTNSTANYNGLSAQLINAQNDGNAFSVYFCMDVPDTQQWMPWNVLLFVDQQSYSPTQSFYDASTHLTTNQCWTFFYSVSVPSGSEFQINIGKIAIDPVVRQQETCDNAKAVLAESHPDLSFQCGTPGLFYTILYTPSGMTEEEAGKLIMDALESAIYPNWTLFGTAP